MSTVTHFKHTLNPVSTVYSPRLSRNIKVKPHSPRFISQGCSALQSSAVFVPSTLLCYRFKPSCLFKILRDENNTNELGARSPPNRNLTCWRCSYPNSYIQTEMHKGCTLLKCEASLSLQVKVITEQREATAWRGQSQASVLDSDYYPFKAVHAAEPTFNTGNIFLSPPELILKAPSTHTFGFFSALNTAAQR